MPNDEASNLHKVEYTPEFKRNIRHLAKKYRHIKSDVQTVIKDLESGKILGTQIQNVGFPVFKARIKNSDIRKGKRAGYRLIYFIKTNVKIILITIYSKTEQGDISAEKIRKIISGFGK